ncbi:MAG: KpsF/GutQ family sugar-phosphate isomerase [Candidatus Omnitrophica bacterium]|nr:KpsF/GutQ family sugar-phosphate isomerase [Candidatus Omnitrophota bacterium]MDE2213950.1 KpsF/GutQ family sugar-phosphate isomerase [Candidatus Omnitrophota bacterium]MDE2231900.1 KpsF/GutQ family sugar-phosphate isomerase [Candidatus Omnitrophota bacterium]
MLKRAKQVLTIEAKAIQAMMRRLGADFKAGVDMIAHTRGRVIVCGMGKSGLVARKMAATLSSTGTPSIFLHSAEGLHGDLGQVKSEDVVIVISQSGETDETVRLLPLVKKIGAKVIVMTGNSKSTLGINGDVVLNIAVDSEGCPLGLAPMASTTVTMALGDALAACLIDRKKFKKEDFAMYHPGGSLGKRLLLRVEDIMRRETYFAKVPGKMLVKDVLWTITRARCGCACVVDGKNKLLGIFTDGDLRRHLEADGAVLQRPVAEIMTKNPASIRKEKLAAQAFDLLKTKKIDELPVVDQRGRVVGLLDVQDLLKAGLV